MLPHYSPYKVAENFRMLEAFHPNRIDLGIGNTVGTPIVNQALNENKERKLSYEQSIDDLTKYLTDKVDEAHRFSGIRANPVISTVPHLSVLSTSVRRAQMAAELGIGYTLGIFPLKSERMYDLAVHATKTYREAFKPSRFLTKPLVSIAPFVVIAETNEKAEEYAEALDFWLLGLDNFSYSKQFPTIETAREYTYSKNERETIAANRLGMVVGSAESVKKQLDQLIEEFGADEVLCIPLMPSIQARKKGLELLASVFKLKCI